MLQSQRENEPADADAVGGSRLARRVLLVGWDGAEFSILEPLLRSGRLPNLSSLLGSGACVELVAPRPTIAPAAWTSLATGKQPHEHGILHANCPSSDGSNLRRITCASRQCVALWNVLNRAGLQTHIVGWPVTHPADTVSGVCVSDWFSAPFAPAPLERGGGPAVSPQGVEPILRARQVVLTQIEEITVAQLLPQQAANLPEYHRLATICRAILAETATLFRAIRWCLREQPWDFAAGVFPGIRRCHELAKWWQSISPAASEFREQLIAGCYEHHDLLLGQLLQQVGDDTHVIAVSPAGQDAAAPSVGDESNILPLAGSSIRNKGLAVMRGLGVRHSATPSQRSVLDLAPTVLAMLAVPYGKDMAGRPWLDLFDADLKPQIVDTWETQSTGKIAEEPCELVAPVDYLAQDNVRNQGVEHLVELGYVDPHDTAAKEAAHQCLQITELNRAISLMDAGMISQAIAVLERITKEDPAWLNSRALLAEAYYRANQRRSARAEIDWLMTQGVEKPQLYFLSGAIECSDRHFDLALDELRCAGRAGVKLPGLSALEGNIYLRRRDFAAAEAAFRSSIEFEGPTHQSLDGLAAVNLHRQHYEEAAISALDALEQEMRFGRAHYHLAVALLHLDKPREALRALESWAAIEPLSAAPFRWLARVSERNFGDAPRAAAYRTQGREVVRRRRGMLKTAQAGEPSAPWSVR
jgi:tetratricopeptide (TPR) repeat protein